MSFKVGINGFGRIGRLVFRIMALREEFDVVAINDLAEPALLAHLLKYDSVHGRYPGDVSAGEDCIIVDGREIRVLAERDPANLPWADMEVACAIESTGVFRKRAQIEGHLTAGARKVLLTVPAKDEIDATIVMGVNDEDLKPEHRIISNASCTTNCLAPVAKVLNDRFGIEQALMTTVHAYTNGQAIIDGVHKDLRRARTAAVNIIPTTTGAARATGKVIPALAGKIDGMAMRVPVANGSVVDLVANLGTEVSVDDVNGAMCETAAGPMSGILEYCEDPIVSTDIIGSCASSVFDSRATMVLGGTGRTVKVISWYDNEWGYSSRVADLLSRAMSF
jgi:glyceraldehyde 3-phosphate dehydrogenase (phosphorylating)